MSKLQRELLASCVQNILAYSQGKTIVVNGEEVVGKQRKFHETIELQVTLKNYDPRKEKRFAGTFKLPAMPKPKAKCCVLGDVNACDAAKKLGIDALGVEDLKKFNKDKKLVKKLAGKYDFFLASASLIKLIPRYLGPGLNRAGKFPTVLAAGEDIQTKVDDVNSMVKFQMKKVTCLNVAVGHVGMTNDQIELNVQLAMNFLASLLKKNWQNIKVAYIKSTMGPSQQIFF
jgi:large subunit ribosomal protein L10Ae